MFTKVSLLLAALVSVAVAAPTPGGIQMPDPGPMPTTSKLVTVNVFALDENGQHDILGAKPWEDRGAIYTITPTGEDKRVTVSTSSGPCGIRSTPQSAHGLGLNPDDMSGEGQINPFVCAPDTEPFVFWIGLNYDDFTQSNRWELMTSPDLVSRWWSSFRSEDGKTYITPGMNTGQWDGYAYNDRVYLGAAFVGW